MKKVKCFLLSEGKYYGIQAALSQSPFSWRDFCWTHRALYSFLTCDRKNNLGDCSTLTSWVTLFGGKTQALHLRARGREQGKTTTSGSSPTFKSPAFSPEALSSWHHRAHVRAQRGPATCAWSHSNFSMDTGAAAPPAWSTCARSRASLSARLGLCPGSPAWYCHSVLRMYLWLFGIFLFLSFAFLYL